MANIKEGLGALFSNKKKYEDLLRKDPVAKPKKKRVAKSKPAPKKEAAKPKPKQPVGLGSPKNAIEGETFEEWKARQKG